MSTATAPCTCEQTTTPTLTEPTPVEAPRSRFDSDKWGLYIWLAGVLILLVQVVLDWPYTLSLR